MAWSDEARAAAAEARRRAKRLAILKPKTRALLADARNRKTAAWTQRFSRSGMAKALRRERRWRDEKQQRNPFSRHYRGSDFS